MTAVSPCLLNVNSATQGIGYKIDC